MQNTLTPEYLCNLGLIHYDEREFDQSLQYFENALHIYRENRNHKGMVTCLMNIALVYDERKDYETAFDHLIQALCIIDDKFPDSYRRKEILETYYTVQSHLARQAEETILSLMIENRANAQEILRLGDEAFRQECYHTASYYYKRAENLAYFLHDALALAEIYQHLQSVYHNIPSKETFEERSVKI